MADGTEMIETRRYKCPTCEGVFDMTPEEAEELREELRKDKVKKWVLPVEVSDDLEDYVVTFPDDLLEAANLKEGDEVEWIDQGDGSFKMIKNND